MRKHGKTSRKLKCLISQFLLVSGRCAKTQPPTRQQPPPEVTSPTICGHLAILESLFEVTVMEISRQDESRYVTACLMCYFFDGTKFNSHKIICLLLYFHILATRMFVLIPDQNIKSVLFYTGRCITLRWPQSWSTSRYLAWNKWHLVRPHGTGRLCAFTTIAAWFEVLG